MMQLNGYKLILEDRLIEWIGLNADNLLRNNQSPQILSLLNVKADDDYEFKLKKYKEYLIMNALKLVNKIVSRQRHKIIDQTLYKLKNKYFLDYRAYLILLPTPINHFNNLYRVIHWQS